MSVAGPHAQPNARNSSQNAPQNAPQNVVEAYAFACLNCGYGWEQEYEIAHRTDAAGRPVVTYLVNGVKVPSPLTRPTCQNCEGHLLRIMRSGQVADVTSHQDEYGEARPRRRNARRDEPHAPDADPETAHHRSVLALLHRRRGSQDPGQPGSPEQPERPERP